MHRFVKFISLLIVSMAMVGCYHSNPNGKAQPSSVHTPAGTRDVTGYNVDSTSEIQNFNYEFYKTHHYAQNYNFVVKKDSIHLLKQQPEEMLSNMAIDSFVVKKNSHIVVADIKILKDDPVDSVWIEVASDKYEFGWIHESQLLNSVVPDDPISQFILMFSDVHLLIFLIIISLIAGGYVVYRLQRRKVNCGVGSYVLFEYSAVCTRHVALLLLSSDAQPVRIAADSCYLPDIGMDDDDYTHRYNRRCVS